jgi:hypothetical protein
MALASVHFTLTIPGGFQVHFTNSISLGRHFFVKNGSSGL